MSSRYWIAIVVVMAAAACAEGGFESEPRSGSGAEDGDWQGATLAVPEGYLEQDFEDDEFPLAESDLRARLDPSVTQHRSLMQKDIFGHDEREQVGSTKVKPYSTVVQMFLTWRLPDGSFFRNECTGTLISSDAVLTAGHCTYQEELGGWLYSSRLVPGLRGSYKPFGETYGVGAYNPPEYRNATSPAESYPHDYGVIRTRDKIGLRAGVRSYAARGSNPRGLAFVLLAYHDDRRDLMMRSLGRIEDVWRNRVFLHHADTDDQSSGGGITTRGNLNRLFGLQVAGNGDGNKGMLFTSAAISNIDRWVRLTPRTP